MFSLKLVAKSGAFQSTKICKKHCFFNANWLPMPLPKEASEQPKIASWASGAALGSQGFFWRPSLDCVGRIFGLGSSLGPFFDALGTFSVFFLNFLSPWDQNVLQRASITFVLQRDVHLKIFVFCFCKFGVPELFVVTSQTEIPKVVSSCYRAGSWEWV